MLAEHSPRNFWRWLAFGEDMADHIEKRAREQKRR